MARIAAATNRADRGEQSALAVIGQVFDLVPSVWDAYSDLAAAAENALVALWAADSALTSAGLRWRLSAMRTELRGRDRLDRRARRHRKAVASDASRRFGGRNRRGAARNVAGTIDPIRRSVPPVPPKFDANRAWKCRRLTMAKVRQRGPRLEVGPALERFVKVLETGRLTEGPYVREFEEKLGEKVERDVVGGVRQRCYRSRGALIDLQAGKSVMAREAIRRKVLGLRTTLGPSAPPLERLLVERVVACWLRSYQADLAYLNSVGSEGRRRLRPNTIDACLLWGGWASCSRYWAWWWPASVWRTRGVSSGPPSRSWPQSTARWNVWCAAYRTPLAGHLVGPARPRSAWAPSMPR